MQAGRTSDDDQIHRLMSKELLLSTTGCSSVFVCQGCNVSRVGPEHRSNTKLRNCLDSANVSFRDVAAADESYMKHVVMTDSSPGESARRYGSCIGPWIAMFRTVLRTDVYCLYSLHNSCGLCLHAILRS